MLGQSCGEVAEVENRSGAIRLAVIDSRRTSYPLVLVAQVCLWLAWSRSTYVPVRLPTYVGNSTSPPPRSFLSPSRYQPLLLTATEEDDGEENDEEGDEERRRTRQLTPDPTSKRIKLDYAF